MLVKKKIILIVLGVVILVMGVAIIYYATIPQILAGNTLSSLNEYYKNFIIYIDGYDYRDAGHIEINANYRGNRYTYYPRDFAYYYRISEDSAGDKFELFNDEGYYSTDANYELLDIFFKLKSLEINEDMELFIATKIDSSSDSIRVDLDSDHINELLTSDFEETYINIYTKGILKSVDTIEVIFDDINISIQDQKYDITYNDNSIKVDLNSSGYSIEINDSLRANAFFGTDKDTLNVVINDNVLYFELYPNTLSLSASTQAAIYNSLDVTIVFSEGNITNSTNFNADDIPLVRYFNALDFSFWRNA